MSWYHQLEPGTRIVIASLIWFGVIPAAIAFAWNAITARRRQYPRIHR